MKESPIFPVIGGEFGESSTGGPNVHLLRHFDEHLTPVARELYRTKRYSTVESYTTPTEEPDVRMQNVVFCQFLVKTVPLDGAGRLDPNWPRRLALTFNKLVKAGRLAHGTLADAFRVDLAWGKVVFGPRQEDVQDIPERRALIGVYCFPSRDTENAADPERFCECGGTHHTAGDPELVRNYLNAFLGNKAFIEEGELADSDWSNLPR